jgi:hypothetical protein
MHIKHVARLLGMVLALVGLPAGRAQQFGGTIVAPSVTRVGSTWRSPAPFPGFDPRSSGSELPNQAPPVFRIVRQPVSQGVYAGGNTELTVVVEGPEGLAYQWFYGTNRLTGAANAFFTNTTSPVLSFVNTSVTNAGDYSVVVSSGSLSVTSSVATLKLIVGLPSILRFTNATNSVVTRTNIVAGEGGPVTNTVTRNRHALPVSFTIQGDDRAVALSLSYDPAVVSNLGFAYNTDLSSNASYVGTNGPGSLAFVYSLATSAAFTNLSQILGTLTFETPSALAPIDALRLARFAAVTALPATNIAAPFLPLPTATTRAYGTNSGTFPLVVVFQPQVFEVGAPVLNRQTGYLVQSADIANIGPEALADVRLVVTGLTNDTRGVQVSLVTSVGPVGTPPNPSIFLGPLASYGGPRRFTLEYYVSDGLASSLGRPGYVAEGSTLYGVTTPEGRRSIVPTLQVVPAGVVLEFPTLTNFSYYVRYSDSLTNFSAQNTNSTEILTASPAFRGNGRRVQWLDNGPPRTQAVPTNRFYRILEFR